MIIIIIIILKKNGRRRGRSWEEVERTGEIRGCPEGAVPKRWAPKGWANGAPA